ncbi:MAG: DUF488 domain-containing protein [Candidatus Obscuribacterales bacterium]
MEIYTIGFTKKTAAQFFGALKNASIEQLVDVRLNNVSQLAGFAKRDDLEFFLSEICSATYKHEPLLAPTQDLLDDYKKKKGSWDVYEKQFLSLLNERQVEKRISRNLFSKRTVLLCSESTAEQCHRRLVVEYLQSEWGPISVKHL